MTHYSETIFSSETVSIKFIKKYLDLLISNNLKHSQKPFFSTIITQIFSVIFGMNLKLAALSNIHLQEI